MEQPKILLLTNLGGGSEDLIRKSVIKSEEVNGQLHILYVKKPLRVVDVDNQFTAKRKLYEDYRTTIKNIKRLLGSPSNDTAKVHLEVRYGNIKSSIKEKIAELEPDFIVMGSKKPKSVPFTGDGLTQWLLKKQHNILFSNNLGEFDLPEKKMAS